MTRTSGQGKGKTPPVDPGAPGATTTTPHPHPRQGHGPVRVVHADPRLFAVMERSGLGETLAGLPLDPHAGTVREVLLLDPAAVDATSLGLSRLATGLLPLWQLAPAQQGVYQRQLQPTLPTLVGNVAGSLRVLAKSGTNFGAEPGPLLELLKKMDIYGTIKVIGMQVNDTGMDYREVTGAFLVFLIDRVLGALDRRFTDPAVPQAQKDRLLEDFAPALLDMEEVLRDPVVRKQDLQAHRQTLGQQARDAQAEAQVQDTALRLRQNLVTPREQLFAAARHYRAKHAPPGAPVLGDPPEPALPTGPGTTRKIF